MAQSDREILERAVRSLSDRAKEADALIDEAREAGLDDSHPVTITAKMLRLELLQMKGHLERKLSLLVLDCTKCSQRVHDVAGLGTTPGH